VCALIVVVARISALPVTSLTPDENIRKRVVAVRLLQRE
jgi:hypothetical protein